MKLRKHISKLLALGILTNNIYFNSSANIEIPNRYQALEDEYIIIDDSTEGELHEIEIFGNTVQDESNLEDIQSVGDLYVDENGNPILDKEGREQYKIDIISSHDIYIDKSTNIEGFEILGATGELNKNSNTIATDYIRVPNNGEYYIHTSKEFQPAIFQYDKDKNYIPYTVDGNIIYDPWGWSTWYEDKYYIYHQENTHYIRIVFNMTDEDCVYPSLNKDKVFPPQAIKASSESIILSTQLQKVGDIADRLYWNSEKGRYVVEKKINKIILDSNSTIGIDNGAYYHTIENIGTKVTGWNIPSNFLTSHFISVNGSSDTSSTNVSCLWRNRIIFRVATSYPTIDDFRIFLKDNPVSVYYKVDTPIIYETNIISKLKISTYEGKTYVFTETESGINPNLKVTVDRLPQIAKNAVEDAEINSSAINISLARMYINMLPESIYKDQLQEQLSQVFSSDIVLDRKTVSANLDIYVKSENMLSMSLDTNLVSFDNYSGVVAMEIPNAVNISINSSLPYSLNSYMVSEIQNSDKSETMPIDIFNIKESSKVDYMQFNSINSKLVLKDNCIAGNSLSHNIDLKLSSNQAHKADIYKTVIKFEAEQK